jgi:hypothetical protein
MDIKRRINDLHNLESDLFNKSSIIANKIKNNHNFKKDIRYTIFNILSSIIRSSKLMLILKDQYLDDEDWWNSNYNKYFSYLDNYFGISENDRQIKRKESFQMISIDLIHFIMVGIYASPFLLRKADLESSIIIL